MSRLWAGLEGVEPRALERALLCLSFLTFAYFHQGGGWNQNSRFAMVRALVEERRVDLDHHIVYVARQEPGRTRLRRLAVENAEVTLEGRRYRLSWRDESGHPSPIGDRAVADAKPIPIDRVAVSGDLSFVSGRFHPNKAPGTAFAATPAYAILHSIERIAGVDADEWGVLTANAWLTTALSVGLISAFGVLAFFRVARGLAGGLKAPAFAAALVFALGTLYLPYATMLYEHNLAAAFLLFALERLSRGERSAPLIAGAWAGLAVVSSYTVAPAACLLAAYALRSGDRLATGLRLALGGAGPLLGLMAYNIAAFATPFTTGYSYQNPVFQDRPEVAILGIFAAPRLDLLPMLLFSPYRGLLFGAPVLIVGLAGLVQLVRDGRQRAEGLLFASIFASLLVMNMSFVGWWGGWGAGPRYLIPAIPFLALPLVRGFQLRPVLTGTLGALSATMMLLVTATDPQSPAGASASASMPSRPLWLQSPITDYALPIFLEGRAAPILRDLQETALRLAPTEEERRRVQEAVDRKDPGVFPLLAIEGPVSASRVGIYEGRLDGVLPPRAPQTLWNSFNLGELIFPHGRLSLAPLLLGWAALLGPLFRQRLSTP